MDLDDLLNGGKHNMFIDGYRFTLEVDRGQQGRVGWKIKMKGDESKEIIEKVKEIDSQLYDHFKSKEVKTDAKGKKTTI